MSSRYSSSRDVTSPQYEEMGDEYHTKSGDWVDQKYVQDAGYDPDTLFASVEIPWRLKQIALHRAQELYAQDSQQTRNTEYWMNQERIHSQERWRLEREWDNRMLLRGNVNYETPNSGGMSGSRARV